MESGGDNENIGEREIIPTNVESHTPFEGHDGMASSNSGTSLSPSSEDDAPMSSMPKPGHGQGSEIQNPPVQVMERPGESTGTSPQYIFPSHVFSKSNINSQVEWSTASNESLFSIYMGNTSFSYELGCFKSCELDKPGEVCMHDQPNASSTHQPPTPTNKFNNISQRSADMHKESLRVAEAKAAETMREVIVESSRATENACKENDKDSSNSYRLSDGSANSYAFQSSKDKYKSVSSNSAGDKPNQEKQPEENETPKEIDDQAPKSTTNAPNNWLNCFACCPFCH